MTIKNCSTCKISADLHFDECQKCTGPDWPHWTDGSEERIDVIGQNGNDGLHYEAGSHYQFSFAGVNLDPYRILDVYGISHPAQQHAIKKLLRAGKSVKTLRQDVEEVQLTLKRWIEMMEESA